MLSAVGTVRGPPAATTRNDSIEPGLFCFDTVIGDVRYCFEIICAHSVLCQQGKIPVSLNAIKVENLKSKKVDYRVADGGGLYVLVRPTGSKLFRYDYRLGDARRTLSIGEYNAQGDGENSFTLKQARDEHEDARAAVKAGQHPISPAQRTAAQAKAKAEAEAQERAKQKAGDAASAPSPMIGSPPARPVTRKRPAPATSAA
jgi:Arm DNA-binding domain